MPGIDFSARDGDQLRSRGIPLEAARRQLRILRNGPAYAALERPCRPGDGIRTASPGEREELAHAFLRARAQGRASMFIPASGAATRMFKGPLAILRRPDRPDWETLLREAGEGREDAAETVGLLQSLASRETFAAFPEDVRTLLRCMVVEQLPGEKAEAYVDFQY